MEYKELFNRAKAAHGTGAYDDATLEFLFPELAESEDDKIWEWFHESVEKGAFLIYEPCEREKILAYLEKWKDLFRFGPGFYLYDGEHTQFCGDPVTEEKQKEQSIKTDACGFPIRDEGEPACSYLERCLAPDMRSIWYEACKEIKEKLKPTEWTENDEGMRNNVINDIKFLRTTTIAVKTIREYDRKIAWLEHLPSGNWKPTEHQMLVLLNAEGTARADGCLGDAKVLASLYEQLKKL